jgi:hypothetical protein
MRKIEERGTMPIEKRKEHKSRKEYEIPVKVISIKCLLLLRYIYFLLKFESFVHNSYFDNPYKMFKNP